MIPILIVVLALVGQLAVAGYALWSAAGAARAGARAVAVGGDAKRAARSALPGWLDDGVEIDDSGPVVVRVRAPALIPGVAPISLGASTDLDPAGG